MGVKTYADPQGAIGAAVPDKPRQQRVYTRSDDAQTGKEYAQSVSTPYRASQQKPLDSNYPKTNYGASPIKTVHDYGTHSGSTVENTAAANTMNRTANTNREFKPTMPTDMHSDSPSVSPITPVRYTDSQMPAVPRAETRVKTEKVLKLVRSTIKCSLRHGRIIAQSFPARNSAKCLQHRKIPTMFCFHPKW